VMMEHPRLQRQSPRGEIYDII
jgi:hypothetical protein